MTQPQGQQERDPRLRYRHAGELAAAYSLAIAAAAETERTGAGRELRAIAASARLEVDAAAALLRPYLPAAPTSRPAAPAPSNWFAALDAAADRLEVIICGDGCWPDLLDLCFAMHHLRAAARLLAAWPPSSECIDISGAAHTGRAQTLRRVPDARAA